MVLLASDFDKSRFFKAADLDGEKKLRIKSVTAEVVGTGDEKERKPIVWFTNDEHGLLLNKTNLRTLRGAFGDKMDEWVGKIVIVFPTTTDLRGKMVPALRVRIPAPKQAGNGAAQAKPAPAPVEPPKPKPPVDPELDELPASDLDDEIPF